MVVKEKCMFCYRALVNLPRIHKYGQAQTQLSLMFLCNQKSAQRAFQNLCPGQTVHNMYLL